MKAEFEIFFVFFVLSTCKPQLQSASAHDLGGTLGCTDFVGFVLHGHLTELQSR